MSTLNRIALLLLISFLIAVFFWLKALNSNEFSSLSALNAQQQSEGFVPVGRFGESWPANIIEVREHDDSIKFKRSNGQPHIYQGFEGYRLRMIRLKSKSGEEVIVVYRSAPIDTPPEMEQSDKPIVRRI